MKHALVFLLVILALIGVADSSYITAQHYRGEDVVCNIGEYEVGDCSTVTSSEYSTVVGVPVALLGAIYYFVLLVLAASMTTYDDKKLRQLFTAIVSIGFLWSAWFVYIQLFVLNAICVYCMVSAVTTTIMLALAIFGFRKRSYDPTILVETN